MSTARELRAVWALVVSTAVAVFVTYARLPADELYHVSRNGVRGGLSRVLVDLNFPDALIALAALGVVAPHLPRAARVLAGLAAALCVVVVVPGVVSQHDLDAKWLNAVPGIGVALALPLTLLARGVPAVRDRRGDAVRIVLAAGLVLLCAPWIAAELGFYLDGVPVLGWLFQTGEIVSFRGNAPHPAVHHGVHHGLQGFLLVGTALLLSRIPSRISLFLALMAAYGVGNIANDAWLEQVAERGWTSWTIPSTLEPAATFTWLAVLVATPLLWLVWFRQPRPTPVPIGAAGASPT
jgi:hypothetical protein